MGRTKARLLLRDPQEHVLAAESQAADGGKNAHYMLRWANAAGERGRWSDLHNPDEHGNPKPCTFDPVDELLISARRE